MFKHKSKLFFITAAITLTLPFMMAASEATQRIAEMEQSQNSPLDEAKL